MEITNIDIKNFIGGEFVTNHSKESIPNICPSTGKSFGSFPDSNHHDALAAIESAHQAFSEWKKWSAHDRAQLLLKIADLIDRNKEDLARAEALDNGKPLKLTISVDIPRSSENFRFFANAIIAKNEPLYTNEDSYNLVKRSALGVVTCISPWNLPLYLLTWKIAPALACGNTVVAKPSEVTPLTAYLLCKIMKEAGLPDGVVNMIHGHGSKLGETLTTHEKVKAISFTGSTATGKLINQMAAPHFKKVSLEMGGKNPNIIFADANYEKALRTTVHSSFANQGQICLCGSRIYIEESVYEKFKNDFVKLASKLKSGPSLEAGIDQGALVSEAHMNKVLNAIEVAKKEGGKVLLGGKRLAEFPGFFVAPTIIENLDISCQTNQEEIFGPVVTLTPFKDEAQAVSYANNTTYGLASSLWTNDIHRTMRVSNQIEAGIVWVNTWMLRDLRTPFGGTKNSGVGREGGEWALNFYSETKNICMKWETN